jgi:hypothetical protein
VSGIVLVEGWNNCRRALTVVKAGTAQTATGRYIRRICAETSSDHELLDLDLALELTILADEYLGDFAIDKCARSEHLQALPSHLWFLELILNATVLDTPSHGLGNAVLPVPILECLGADADTYNSLSNAAEGNISAFEDGNVVRVTFAGSHIHCVSASFSSPQSSIGSVLTIDRVRVMSDFV